MQGLEGSIDRIPGKPNHQAPPTLTARAELHNLLREERLFGATLLIFANKQDIASALPVAELEKVRGGERERGFARGRWGLWGYVSKSNERGGGRTDLEEQGLREGGSGGLCARGAGPCGRFGDGACYH